MTTYHLTNVGQLLHSRGELSVHLAALMKGRFSKKLADLLVENKLWQINSTKKVGKYPAWWYVTYLEVVDFELTYGCNLSCAHCQQGKMEDRQAEPLLTEAIVKKTLDDAKFAGIIRRGINFTGGEPLLYRPDILRLLEHVRDLDCYTRLNSNGWWGKQNNISIGGRNFTGSRELVRQLMESGLTLLALSLDGLAITHDKRRGKPGLFSRVMDVINSCQAEGLLIRLIATGVPLKEREPLTKLITSLGLPVDASIEKPGSQGQSFYGLGFRETVEIGSAALSLPEKLTNLTWGSALLENSLLLCHGRGFARPKILHIDPLGNVRTCTFAMGLANMGNVVKESLLDILNRYPSDHVSKTFIEHFYNHNDALPSAIKRLFLPDFYRQFQHPCAFLVVLARLLDAEGKFISDNSREPTLAEIQGFNLAVAKSLSLLSGRR
ncbi:radical SAM protein [Candidatus Saganbacteria bacterium]|nr:radical SAM protein [Candidatus Saganbacteria bacterium]